MMNPSKEILKKLTNLLGTNGVLTKPEDILPYLKDERRLLESNCSVVLRPANTKEVSKSVKLCASHNISIVPLGGNTGLVGGGIASGGVIPVSYTHLTLPTILLV